MKKVLLYLMIVMHCCYAWGAMPIGYTFYTTTNGVSTAFTALSSDYTCAIGIAWNSSLRTSASIPTDLGAGISTDYQGSFVIPSRLKDEAYRVTEIGYKAFYKCQGITAVYIPSSITYIDVSAFSGCTSLTQVSIPGSVSIIDQFAFTGCQNLTELILQDGIKKIESEAFLGCKSLKSVDIPASVTAIGSSAFGGAQLNFESYGHGSYVGCDNIESVMVHWDDPISLYPGTFSNAANATLYVPMGTIEKYANANGWKEFGNIQSIPSNIEFADPEVKRLCVANWDTNGDGEFDTSEASVVTSLGTVFRGNTNITSFNELEFFTGLTQIDNYAFQRCSGLTSVAIPKSVTSIGMYAFGECKGLTSVHITDIAAWCNISFWAQANPLNYAHHLYLNDEEIKDLVIPNGVTSIGDAFSGCTGLTSVEIPNSVTTIGISAFYGCSGLTTITIPNSVTKIGESAFKSCSGLTSVTIPNSVTTIDNETFAYCRSLTSITIPNSVTTICYAAFEGCTGLTSVKIPNSVTSLGGEAFVNCSGLTTVTLSNSITYMSDAFRGCTGLTTFAIPNGVKTIGEDAFRGYTWLSSVEIPNSVTNIGESSFRGCSGLSSVEIPNSVIKIGESAFRGCSGLTSVTIPNSVTTMGNSAFQNCSRLASVSISNSIMTIGNSAFSGCSELTSVEIPNSVTTINNSAFYGCSGLISVEIPNSVTTIGESAFENCINLSSINIHNIIPNNKIVIGSKAFKGCIGLISVMIPECVSGIRNYAFQKCTNLTSVEIANGVNYIDEYAFSGCRSLESITIPSSVIGIGYEDDDDEEYEYYVFENCTNLSSIVVEDGNSVYDSRNNCNAIIKSSTNELIAGCKNTIIPNSVSSIYDGAFAGCTGLSTITIPSSVAYIEYGAFSGCAGLKSIKCERTTPPAISSWPFGSVDKSIPIYVPSEAVTAYQNANYWKLFTNIQAIPSSIEFADAEVKRLCVANWDTDGDGELSEVEAAAVTSIGTVFKENTEITSFEELSYFTGLTAIDNSAFSGCSNLISVIIPENVTSIEDDVFSGCSSLASITIPNGVTNIGSRSFANCSSLTELTIPNSVESIEQTAFIGCSGLTSMTVEEGGVYDSRNNCNAIIEGTSKTLLVGCKTTVIPEDVTAIGNYAFYGYDNLEFIEIPGSVTAIGSTAFARCNNLLTVTAAMKLPVPIAENTFTSRFDATLYVPKGSKSLYMAAEYWKDFCDIEEIYIGGLDIVPTDISSLPNAIYANAATGFKGGVTMLTICLKNALTTNGYSFELKLPEGVTLAKDNNDEYIYTLSNRHNGHVATVNYKDAAGVYGFAVMSLSSKDIKESDGAIITLTLNISDEMAEGEYEVKVQNAKYSLSSGATSIAMEDVTSLLTVEKNIKGDANGDGFVDIADAVCIVNHIVGKATPAYKEAAADANGDGVVDIADAVRIVNLIVGKIDALARKQDVDYTLPDPE